MCSSDLDAELRAMAGHAKAGLIVCHGSGAAEIARLATELRVQAVFTNHDDEPAALQRDQRVRGLLAERGIALETYKDHVVFERSEVLTQSGTSYGVFTPYKRAWLKKAQEDPFYLRSYPVSRHARALAPRPAPYNRPMPSLIDLGFEATNLSSLHLGVGSPGGRALLEDFAARMQHYGQRRDFPGLRGPSYLSVHLRDRKSTRLNSSH